MKELNYHPQIFATEAAISEKAIEKYTKEGYEGIVEGAILATPSFDRENVKAKNLLGIYETKYGSTKGPVPETYLAAHYDAVYLLGEASLKVGTNSDSVREYFLNNIKNWQGAMGNFSFNEQGDAVTNVIAMKVKDGKIVPYK
jgi:branched-chain amino acid transport system substrate-binding protein